MPAVNPMQLRNHIEQILADLHDPPALRRQVNDLYRFYADRTYRPGESTEVDDAPWVLNVAPAVLRAVQRALRNACCSSPELAQEVADALWDEHTRETQITAAGIVGCHSGPWVAAWVQERVQQCDDRPTLRVLAGAALQGWREQFPQDYFGRIVRWLKRDSRQWQGFALTALEAEVCSGALETLPQIFRILADYAWSDHGEPNRALCRLMLCLIKLSPQETSRFLLDEIAVRPQAVRRLLPHISKELPLPLLQRIQQTL